MICNPRNIDWNKSINELRDKLNYHNGFTVKSKDVLQAIAAKLDISIRDYFISSGPEKIIQDKSMMWRTIELRKFRKNTRRELRIALCWSERED